MRWVIAAGLFCGLSIVSGSAKASGLEVGDLGPTALGRGWANVVKAHGGEAYYYNPAALSRATGWQLYVGGSWVRMRMDHRRIGSGLVCQVNAYGSGNRDSNGNPTCVRQFRDPDNPDAPVYDPNDSSGGHWALDPRFDINAAKENTPYLTMNFRRIQALPWPSVTLTKGDLGGVRGLSIAVGLTSPATFADQAYDPKGTQRYALAKGKLFLAYGGVGLAYRINQYLQLGATFDVGVFKGELEQASRTQPKIRDLALNEDQEKDVSIGLEVHDYFVPTATFGLLSQPVDFLQFGASLRLPASVRAVGKMHYSPSTVLPDSKLAEPDREIGFRVHYPLKARAGMRWVQRRFDLELNYVYEHWSSLSQIEIKLNEMPLDLNGDGSNIAYLYDTKIPKNFRDTHSLRLGGDVEVWPKRMTFRAGTSFTRSAYPKNHDTFAVDFPVSTQISLSGGVTFRVIAPKDSSSETPGGSKVSLDLVAGYAHIFQPKVQVTRGILQQNAPRPTPDSPSLGNIVNNGTYDLAYNLLGLALDLRL